MHVVGHYTCGNEFVPLFVPVQDAIQNNVSGFWRQNSVFTRCESDCVLCPWSLEVREIAFAVADFGGFIRRAAGCSRRAACAPQSKTRAARINRSIFRRVGVSRRFSVLEQGQRSSLLLAGGGAD